MRLLIVKVLSFENLILNHVNFYSNYLMTIPRRTNVIVVDFQYQIKHNSARWLLFRFIYLNSLLSLQRTWQNDRRVWHELHSAIFISIRVLKYWNKTATSRFKSPINTNGQNKKTCTHIIRTTDSVIVGYRLVCCTEKSRCPPDGRTLQ